VNLRRYPSGYLGDATKEYEKKSAGFLRVIESRRDEIGEGFRIGNLRSATKEYEKKSAGFLRVIESRRDEIGEGFLI
jgi:hypothetical protein